MNEKLDTTAKQIGDVLIGLSDARSEKMEKWSDVPVRPNGLGATECAGFITKEAETGLSLVADIQAPANSEKAALRTWGIASQPDGNGNERFNNIQLDFDMDYAVARQVAQKGAAVTRDDIRTALHHPSTRLAHVTVSNQSGFDEASGQPLGERYDVGVDELGSEGSADAIDTALHAVLATLNSAV